MKTIQLYFGIFLSIFIFSSCEKDIVFNGEISAPQIVVNSYITPDSVVSAQISESRFFLSDSTTFVNINNADVAVWVNGTFKEKMSLLGYGIYKGTYKPAIGETIKLVVNAPSKKEVSCETKIYPQPVISSIDTSSVSTSVFYIIPNNYSYYNEGSITHFSDTTGKIISRKIKCTLKLNDNANEKNYYRLVVLEKQYYIKTDSVTHIQTPIESDYYLSNLTDAVTGNNASNDLLSLLGQNSSYSVNYDVFSDDLFNGKTYALTFNIYDNTYIYYPTYKNESKLIREEVFISLQNISKDYYLYLKSRVAANNNGNSFFSEPVQIYNNISGGIGIFGSYTSSDVVKFDL